MSKAKTTFTNVLLIFSEASTPDFRIPNGGGNFKRETNPDDFRYQFFLFIFIYVWTFWFRLLTYSLDSGLNPKPVVFHLKSQNPLN
jgi:hypothetical protein